MLGNRKELKDMDSEEYESYRKRSEEEKQKNGTRISKVKGKSKECKTRLPWCSEQGHQEPQWKVLQEN